MQNCEKYEKGIISVTDRRKNSSPPQAFVFVGEEFHRALHVSALKRLEEGKECFAVSWTQLIEAPFDFRCFTLMALNSVLH